MVVRSTRVTSSQRARHRLSRTINGKKSAVFCFHSTLPTQVRSNPRWSLSWVAKNSRPKINMPWTKENCPM